MADQTVTLDELTIGLLVAGVDVEGTPDKLVEAVDTLRAVRRAVSLVADLHGVSMSDVLDPADSMRIIGEASEIIAAGIEATR